MKFVATQEYYPNCRVHDSGYSTQPFFFNTLDGLLDYLKNEDANSYSICDIYSCEDGKEDDLKSVYYNLGSHSVIGITVNWNTDKYNLIDNGSGVKIWDKQS